ncbi:protein of unknown function DUF1360 [Kribbella flavida DSM 17836]|uniref:DUF1360 domain-containing protein n=2 Tax=Kribbella flavida TaxID=182640 RepID=D2PVI6_KRIFD|nr:protein of unknown function DUF1360 [Kribbella flavida DSM 17836]
MTAMHEKPWSVRARAQARRLADQYGAEQSLRGYAGAMTAFTAYCGALAAAGRVAGRKLPARVEPLDLLVGAAAVFRASRLAAKNSVTAPVRAPFTQYRGPGAPAETNEEARGTGVQRTIGELLTCPFCVSVWATATYSAGLVLMPRATRFTAAALATLAGADLLNLSHGYLTRLASGDD